MMVLESTIYSGIYLAIVYHALLVISQNNPLTPANVVIDDINYLKLTLITCAFLICDFFYKRYNRTRYKTYEYYGMQAHHFIALFGFWMSYSMQYCQVLVCNLALFEISSIPLAWYSNRICVKITLPLLWLTYLLFRIIWGNLIIIHYLYHLQTYAINQWTSAVALCSCVFFLLFNNFYFCKLTCIYQRHRSKFGEKANFAKPIHHNSLTPAHSAAGVSE